MSLPFRTLRGRLLLRRRLHHRRDVGGAGVHQFHGLRHGAGQRFVPGERLDLLFPEIDVVARQLLDVVAGIVGGFVFAALAHGVSVPLFETISRPQQAAKQAWRTAFEGRCCNRLVAVASAAFVFRCGAKLSALRSMTLGVGA